MARPRVVSIQVVAAVMPAKAEPLLLPADVNAYRISVRPWAPEFQIVVSITESTNIDAAGEAQHGGGHGEDVERDDLHLGRLDLLAEVLRRSPDHQAGDEHRQDGHDQQPAEADADAAGADLAEHHVAQRRRRRRAA